MPAPPANSTTLSRVAVFALLAAIAVVGRWGQPDWCVTPIAAAGLLAGYALPPALALSVPVAALWVSNLALPSYGSWWLAAAVYAALLAAPLLGRWLRRPIGSRLAGLARLSACATAPSVVFFVTTNFVVWATHSRYAPDLAGLAECYAMAIPFFRRMLAGDLAYTALLFGAAAAAGAFSLSGLPPREFGEPARVAA